MPAHIYAANFMLVTTKGEPASDVSVELSTRQAVSTSSTNQLKSVQGFDDNNAIDIDTETQALVLELESANMTDPALKAFGAKMYGRLLGETIAHEIVHGLLGDQINPPSDHNNPAIANDLMNAGSDRISTSYRARKHGKRQPLDPCHFVGHGINAIGELQAGFLVPVVLRRLKGGQPIRR